MNEIKIPKSVMLFGQRYQVEYNEKLHHSDSARGMAYHRTQKIELLPDTPTFPVSRQQMEVTFLHELLHICLNEMSECELRDNEKFVDILANLLHQAFSQAEY